jgi:hypothetical protein
VVGHAMPTVVPAGLVTMPVSGARPRIRRRPRPSVGAAVRVAPAAGANGVTAW